MPADEVETKITAYLKEYDLKVKHIKFAVLKSFEIGENDKMKKLKEEINEKIKANKNAWK